MQRHYEYICEYCGKEKKRRLGDKPSHHNWSGKSFCDRKCRGLHDNKTVTKPCQWCGELVERKNKELKKSKSGYVFCNQSCSASYNNTLRRKSRRSKVEKLLFELLKEEFPDLEIIANDKTLLDGYEADIAFPQINLCIEWNGVVHYRPIYGQDKLDDIQKRDVEKQHIAQEKGINLIVVPDLVSTDVYVKEAFQDIKKIIKRLPSDLNREPLR